MSGASALSVGTFGWASDGGSGASTPPSPAPEAHRSSTGSGTFSVVVDSVSGQDDTSLALQVRAFRSADEWVTVATGPATVGSILTATGLSSSAQYEWRIVEIDDVSLAVADGSHGEVSPVAAETIQVQWYMKQTAVLWRLAEEDSNGLPTWANPIDIRCRWEEAQDIQGLGEPLRFKVNAMLDRDVKDGDYLMLGTVTSGTSMDPRDELSWEVTQFDLLPDVAAKKFVRTVQCAPSPLKFLQQRGRGSEAVTYKSLLTGMVGDSGVLVETFSEIDVPAAARSNLQAESIGGKYRSTDVVWDISKKYLTSEPSLKGDHIVDSNGVRWDVIGCSENRLLRGWWRIVTRRGKS